MVVAVVVAVVVMAWRKSQTYENYMNKWMKLLRLVSGIIINPAIHKHLCYLEEVRFHDCKYEPIKNVSHPLLPIKNISWLATQKLQNSPDADN